MATSAEVQAVQPETVNVAAFVNAILDSAQFATGTDAADAVERAAELEAARRGQALSRWERARVGMAAVLEWNRRAQVPPFCPKCGSVMHDVRSMKRTPKSPDYRCANGTCDGIIWPPRELQAQGGVR